MKYPKATGRVVLPTGVSDLICRLQSSYMGDKAGRVVYPGTYYVIGSWVAKTIVDVGGTLTLYTAASTFRGLLWSFNGNSDTVPVDYGAVISNYPTTPSNLTPEVSLSFGYEGFELHGHGPFGYETEFLASMRLELKLDLPEV